MCELLWSDPQSQPGRGPSKRGVGLSFGGDVTKKFLEENNLGWSLVMSFLSIIICLLLGLNFHYLILCRSNCPIS